LLQSQILKLKAEKSRGVAANWYGSERLAKDLFQNKMTLDYRKGGYLSPKFTGRGNVPMCTQMTMIAIELQAGELKDELRLGHPRAPPISDCAGLLTDVA